MGVAAGVATEDGSVADIGETEVEGGWGGEKGLAGVLLLVEREVRESGDGCGGCGGDTKGLAGLALVGDAGVTKGMVVAAVVGVVALVVVALVASGRPGTHGHGDILLLDGHGGARRTPARDGPARGTVGDGRARRGATRGGGRRLGSLVVALASCPASALCGSGHGRVEAGELLHHALVHLLLVGVHGLGMSAEVVETRKVLSAVAAEGALAGVFPVTRQVLAAKVNMTSQRARTGGKTRERARTAAAGSGVRHR